MKRLFECWEPMRKTWHYKLSEIKKGLQDMDDLLETIQKTGNCIEPKSYWSVQQHSTVNKTCDTRMLTI